jgi:hypothetical protein
MTNSTSLAAAGAVGTVVVLSGVFACCISCQLLRGAVLTTPGSAALSVIKQNISAAGALLPLLPAAMAAAAAAAVRHASAAWQICCCSWE